MQDSIYHMTLKRQDFAIKTRVYERQYIRLLR